MPDLSQARDKAQTPQSGQEGQEGQESAPSNEITFTLDGKVTVARPGEMLISAAERAGTFIPRFCYHPRMKSVGVCRMCLVEVEGPRGATLQPSCFIPVTESMVVNTSSEKVKKAQDGVLEFLLANHPLDCPVCDKGGECPLQDQTIAYGPGESRFIEEKRHFEKPIAISELVLLDRERCIQCSRCTRFADEVAGEALIDFAGRGESVEVATFPGTPFSSYFSGNTVQICPVGALTASPYRFTARPWDLDQVESTCTTCAVGCRIAVQSSGNRLTRLLGIDSEPVNHGWLCDKGRFVFEAVNGDEVDSSPQPSTSSSRDSASGSTQFSGEVKETGNFSERRITEPLIRRSGKLQRASWDEALAYVAGGIQKALATGGPNAIAAIGGAYLTNESSYAWTKLLKGLLGSDSLDSQLGDGLPAELILGLPRATIDQACSAKVLLTLTGDLREELPVLFLRLRKAVVEDKVPLIEFFQTPTPLTEFATVGLRARPGDTPALARAIVGDWSGYSSLENHPEGLACGRDQVEAANSLLTELVPNGGEGLVVILGRPSLSESAEVVSEAASLLAESFPNASFLPALRRGNVFGAIDMGMAPGLLPGRVTISAARDWFSSAWGGAPQAKGLDCGGILASMAGIKESIVSRTGNDNGNDNGKGNVDAPNSSIDWESDSTNSSKVSVLLLLGADPISDFSDSHTATLALKSDSFVVAVTGHHSRSTAFADVVLPAAVSHERSGTTTNLEGRVSHVSQKITPLGFAWQDWMIASELAKALGLDLGIESAASLASEIGLLAPAYFGYSPGIFDSQIGHDGFLAPFDSAFRVGQDLGVGDGHGVGHALQVNVIDPVASPGIESVELQGAPPRSSLAEVFGVDLRLSDPSSSDSVNIESQLQRPAMISKFPSRDKFSAHVPPPDSYSLRLVSTRRLYDHGTAIGASPSLVGLSPPLVVRANPYDLDRLGVKTGDIVRLRSSRGDLEIEAESFDGLARGTVSIDFNISHSSTRTKGDRATDEFIANAAGSLIDFYSPVTEVRMESI